MLAETEPTMIGLQKANKCLNQTESYAFLIIWNIVNYIVVLFFTILLLAWYDIHQKSNKIRKSILEIVR